MPLVATASAGGKSGSGRPKIVIRQLFRGLWMLLGWTELILLGLPLYLSAWLPGPRGNGYRRLFRIWCRAFVHALGVDLRLHQKNLHRLPQRYLLIANHPSAFEDVGIPALFDVDSLAKNEVRDWPLVGRIAAAAGTLFVQRDSRASRAQVTEQIIARLGAGRNVALYPEGGVMGKRLHHRFLYGVFDISLRTGIPIVPVFIHYEAQDDFFWHRQTLLKKMMEIMGSANNRANYYLYDAFLPQDYADKAAYAEQVHRCFVDWQSRYLD